MTKDPTPFPRKRLLFIAYHFPPIQGSTGTTRTVAFAKYLRSYGWDVCVLTISPKAYEHSSDENTSLVPSWVSVERAWGRDTKRAFAIKGRYPQFLALPDRWQSWIGGGYVKGCRILERWSPDLLFSTYPIPSAHVIGFLLNRKFRVPWVAEFRDPMLQPTYPANTWERKAFGQIEKLTFSSAAEIVVTTDGCRRMYEDRFPSSTSPRVSVVPNGYDPEMFAGLENPPRHSKSDTLILLHSGILYPHERNPTEFFNAIQSLTQSGFFSSLSVKFHFRATGHEEEYQRKVSEMGIDTHVRILPRLPYRQALEEMTGADALMLFQANNCNDQIPAKVYEYMYCQKPILAFADPQGDTGRLLESVGVRSIAQLENRSAIENILKSFLPQLRSGKAFIVSESDASRFSRKSLTGDLNDVLTNALRTRPR